MRRMIKDILDDRMKKKLASSIKRKFTKGKRTDSNFGSLDSGRDFDADKHGPELL